jgi:hypothetical protein
MTDEHEGGREPRPETEPEPPEIEDERSGREAEVLGARRESLRRLEEAGVPPFALSLETALGVREPDPIAVHYNTAGLAPGEHNATIRISSEDAYNSPQTVAIKLTVEAARMDFDRDGDVDVEDFGHLQVCLKGSTVPQTDPACTNADVNSDRYVDRFDVDSLINCLSGPDLPPGSNCAPRER